ncbi:MAG: lysylphosphatidylglycerol synthase domain-containing protein [Pseudomonadota bacterium]
MDERQTKTRGWRRLLSLTVVVLSVPALGLWVHLTVGWPRLLTPWIGLTVADYGVLFLGMAIAYLARAARLFDFFRDTVARAPFGLLRLSLLHNLSNHLLPMRTGEAAFPLLMKRYFGVSFADAGLSLVWLRVLDLAALTLLASTVIARGSPLGPLTQALALTLALGSAAALLLLPWAVHLLPAAFDGGRTQRLIHAIASNLPRGSAAYARAVLLTLVAWAAKGFALLWLALQFTALSASTAAVGVAAGELSSVLPIHGLAGSGTYEGAMVAALVAVGAEHDVALLAAVNVHLFLLGTAFALGVSALLLPRPPSPAKPDRVS